MSLFLLSLLLCEVLIWFLLLFFFAWLCCVFLPNACTPPSDPHLCNLHSSFSFTPNSPLKSSSLLRRSSFSSMPSSHRVFNFFFPPYQSFIAIQCYLAACCAVPCRFSMPLITYAGQPLAIMHINGKVQQQKRKVTHAHTPTHMQTHVKANWGARFTCFPL